MGLKIASIVKDPLTKPFCGLLVTAYNPEKLALFIGGFKNIFP